MATFFTEATSRSILRGVIRDATSIVPPMEEIVAVFQKATSLFRNVKKIQRIITEYAMPFCLEVRLEDLDPAKGGGASITAAIPAFEQVDVGWNLVVHCVTILVRPKGAEVVTDMVPTVTFYGHALQRFFQRSGVIGWDRVREHLVCAMLLVDYVYREAPSDLLQVQLPFVQGSFLGEHNPEDGSITIKTYLHHRGTKPHLLEFQKLLIAVGAEHKVSIMTTDGYARHNFRKDFLYQARQHFPFMFDSNSLLVQMLTNFQKSV